MHLRAARTVSSPSYLLGCIRVSVPRELPQPQPCSECWRHRRDTRRVLCGTKAPSRRSGIVSTRGAPCQDQDRHQIRRFNRSLARSAASWPLGPLGRTDQGRAHRIAGRITKCKDRSARLGLGVHYLLSNGLSGRRHGCDSLGHALSSRLRITWVGRPQRMLGDVGRQLEHGGNPARPEGVRMRAERAPKTGVQGDNMWSRKIFAVFPRPDESWNLCGRPSINLARLKRPLMVWKRADVRPGTRTPGKGSSQAAP